MLSAADFLAFYPQFSLFAQGAVLPEYLRQANARFSDFGEDAEEARRLFTAHKLTMYAAGCLNGGTGEPTEIQLASAGRAALQEIASKKAGEVAVTYHSSSATSSGRYTGLNDLKETAYGVQLLTLLRLYGFAKYIP